MAKFRHISTKMVLALDAGQVNGKKVTKRVIISNIREDASTDALWELAEALGKLLAYPVAEVRLYKVEELVREAGDGDAPETDRETGTEAAAAAGSQVNDDAAARDGLRHDEHAAAQGGSQHGGYTAARFFGGVGKNGQLSRSFNDGYWEPRLSVFYIGNDRALRAPSRAVAGGAAIPYQTPPGYTRPPPWCENVRAGCY